MVNPTIISSYFIAKPDLVKFMLVTTTYITVVDPIKSRGASITTIGHAFNVRKVRRVIVTERVISLPPSRDNDILETNPIYCSNSLYRF
jgi:hypothetical protein